MICEEFNINNALGVRIFNEIRLGSVFLEKGHALTDSDIIALKLIGVTKIFGAQIEDNDITNSNALGIICAKLCGKHTAYHIGSNGLAKIIANRDGFLKCSEDRIAKFNRISHNVVLNTIEPYSFVQEGEIIANLEITEPLLEQEQVDDIIFKLSGNVELISVARAQSVKTALIYTKFYNDAVENRHFTSVVKKLVQNFSSLGLSFDNEYETQHTTKGLSDTLDSAIRDGNEAIFIISAQRNSGQKDVIPLSLKSIVDEILVLNIPQVGVSDLVIANKRSVKIINIPYAYALIDSEITNHYVRQTILNDKLNPFDFTRPQNVVINKNVMINEEERGEIISSGNKALDSKDANIAAIVLAAGIGKRAGRNKLLLDIDGEPMFMKAVRAAVKSKASPVFIITGYKAPELEEYMENVDVNILYNPSFHSGIKTSINLGLKSVPNFCDGVIILPADMPNITDEHLNKMIDVFDKSKNKQLVMTSYKDTKNNPILWSNTLYDVADVVAENSDIRPIFMEHVDYTKYVEVKNEDEVFDVNFPVDVEKITKD